MKAKMIKNKSFIRQFLIQNAISVVIIFIVFIIVFRMQDYFLNSSFPTIDDVLEYEDRLMNDEFSKLPITKYKDLEILIFDENNKIIYTTDKEIANEIEYSDIENIDETISPYEWTEYKCIKKEKKQSYYISKVRYKNDEETFIDDVILNYDLDVLSGNLFGGKTKLTQTEFDLVNGLYKNKYGAEKYVYETIESKKRTLLVLYPQLTIENYNRAEQRTNKTFALAIPLILIVILVNTILTKRSLKKSLSSLEKIINDYENHSKIENITEKVPLELKDTADKFEQLLKKLEASKLEKNRVIANIAHDLKTPMTAIMGYIEAFRDDIVPENKKNQYIDSIQDRIFHSTELVNRLAEYTKLEHPEYKMKLEELDINGFTKGYIELKKEEINLNGFIIKTEIPERECKINADRELIIRAYDNLLSNILKYNPSNTNILFKTEEIEEKIKITIADNGVGIVEDIKEKVFEPFITGNEARTSGEGTGLGMAIVNHIVELHNGEIRLNENPEEGYVTEFNIFFKKVNK